MCVSITDQSLGLLQNIVSLIRALLQKRPIISKRNLKHVCLYKCDCSQVSMDLCLSVCVRACVRVCACVCVCVCKICAFQPLCPRPWACLSVCVCKCMYVCVRLRQSQIPHLCLRLCLWGGYGQ